MKAFVSFATAIVAVSAALPAAPIIDTRARVKQHRSGARGDLVKGEEEMHKILVFWPENPRAEVYEMCH